MLTDFREEQPSNALLPMLFTDSGMTIVVRILQLRKAEHPMFVTELGIDTEVSSLQPLNPLSLMLVTVQDTPLFFTVEGMVRLPTGLVSVAPTATSCLAEFVTVYFRWPTVKVVCAHACKASIAVRHKTIKRFI